MQVGRGRAGKISITLRQSSAAALRDAKVTPSHPLRAQVRARARAFMLAHTFMRISTSDGIDVEGAFNLGLVWDLV